MPVTNYLTDPIYELLPGVNVHNKYRNEFHIRHINNHEFSWW